MSKSVAYFVYILANKKHGTLYVGVGTSAPAWSCIGQVRAPNS